MLQKDLNRLKRPYPSTIRPEDREYHRLAEPLGLTLTDSVALGDEFVVDLDPSVRGIGWWNSYTDIDRKTRILLSDYLVACARAIPDNASP